MSAIIIEPHYFPSLEYFCALQPFDKVVLESHEYYIKQTYRNRCYINTTNGIHPLVVPVTAKHGKVPLKEVRIDWSQKWRNNHWRTIQSAYAKAAFFEHYGDELKAVLDTDFEFLIDLDKALLSLCLRFIGTAKTLSETVAYEKDPAKDIFDLRSQLNPGSDPSGRLFYKPQPYYQLFGKSFAGNLSIIDLLFSEGPNALSLLIASGETN